MKRLLFLLAVFCSIHANAQNYYITFTGSGATTTVGSVLVENLTAGTSLTVSTGYRLSLTFPTGINPVENKQSSELNIYPNPTTGNSLFRVYPPVSGNATISVFDMTGKQVAQIQNNLENCLQEFRLSGLNKGLYLINVKGKTYQYSGKLLSNAKAAGTISIEKTGNNLSAVEIMDKSNSKGGQNIIEYEPTVDMEYSEGDRLKFTGISDIYKTVLTDIPTSNKTIIFNFIACTDGDNNNYSVVDIGGQIWMAENLKTTKYNDGSTSIPNIVGDGDWLASATGAYCDYGNIPANSTTYGRLYNWFVVDNNEGTKVVSNGGKNVCPTGWHVPNDVEWTTLTDYLTNNGYGYEGSGSDIAKSMAVASGWAINATLGTVGNDQASNNSSGFTALPAGLRFPGGSYFNIGKVGYWWSPTVYSKTYAEWFIGFGLAYVSSGVVSNTQNGLSVRCLKD